MNAAETHRQCEQVLAEQIREVTQELEMLRAFANRHGWRTADGVYVAGSDHVYYCTCEYTPTTPKADRLTFKPWETTQRADEVIITQRPVWFSTPEAAEAHARKEWES